MGEDTQKTQDFTEAHPGNTSLHGEYTVNGASGLDELYVKDNDRITVEFKADEDYFLKDVIYNGKSMLGSLKETYASDGSSQAVESWKHPRIVPMDWLSFGFKLYKMVFGSSSVLFNAFKKSAISEDGA